MKGYISEHWRGQQSLMRSLILNTIVFNIGMVVFYSFLTNWIEANWSVPDIFLFFSLILFWVVVLSWQAVGSFRAATIRIQNYGSVTNYYCVFAVMLACTIFTLASVATQYGESIDYRQQAVDDYKPPLPTFNITLAKSNQLSLTGEIGYGATEKLASLLSEHTQINWLVLNSEGGLIVEARGLANTIKAHQLNTHVSQRCFSACTLAFIAGNQRSLAENGQLGFHRYNLESNASMPWIKPSMEQQKDLQYFKDKSVAMWFMEQAYSIPHSSIWTPSRQILHSAGVITTTGISSP